MVTRLRGSLSPKLAVPSSPERIIWVLAPLQTQPKLQPSILCYSPVQKAAFFPVSPLATWNWTFSPISSCFKPSNACFYFLAMVYYLVSYIYTVFSSFRHSGSIPVSNISESQNCYSKSCSLHIFPLSVERLLHSAIEQPEWATIGRICCVHGWKMVRHCIKQDKGHRHSYFFNIILIK